MILFFRTQSKSVIATEVNHALSDVEIKELCWLYGDATYLQEQTLQGYYVGPRREMITPWSTNAVEITQNMSLNGISRIEEYFPVDSEEAEHDPMLQRMYHGIGQDVFKVDHKPEPIKYVNDLEKYNEEEGLALSKDEISYLHTLEKDNHTIKNWEEDIREQFQYLPYAPIIFVSALTKQRLHKLPEMIKQISESQNTRIPSAVLNDVIMDAIAINPTPTDKGKRLKIFYATQVATKPPTFVIFVNEEELMHFSYLRFLENQIRKAFVFEGTPIHLIARKRK